MAYKYDAFISYRHTEEDKFVAETLHKELEAFRLSKRTIKKIAGKELKRTRITRVFRDRDELPITSDLSDPITRALEESEFLIVICSPRLKESLWCEREIETFIRLHGREKIFAVLTSGEPKDSFPEQICVEQRHSVDENGNTITTDAEIEPLAADVRGKNRREIKKKIREEVVRLAAPMLGCGYDDLKQRHREQKLKRIILGVSLGCAISLLFGAVSLTMALRIREQSVKISEQSDELEEQYISAMKTNAELEAQNARRILAMGDRRAAIKTVRKMLPEKKDDLSLPYVPDCQETLTEALYVYENGNKCLPLYTMDLESAVSFIKLSPDKTRALVVEQYGTITVWDIKKHEKICELQGVDTSFGIDEQQAAFVDDNSFLYPTDEGFAVYDIKQGKKIYENSEFTLFSVVTDGTGGYAALTGYDSLSVYDCSSWSEIYSYSGTSDLQLSAKAALSKDKKLLAVAADNRQTENNEIILLDFDTGEQVSTIPIGSNNGLVKQLLFDNDKLYVAENFAEESEEKVLPDYSGMLYALSTDGAKEPLWTYCNKGGAIQSLFMAGKTFREYVGYSTYDVFGVVESLTGALAGSNAYGKEIVYCEPFESNGELLSIITRSGMMNYYQLATMEDYGETASFDATSNNLSGALCGNGYVMTYGYEDIKPVVYARVQGPKVEEIFEAKGYCSAFTMSADQKTAAFLEENSKVIFYDLTENKAVSSCNLEEPVSAIAFLNDGKSALVFCNEMGKMIDISSGKVQETITKEMGSFDSFAAGTSYAVFATYDSLDVYDTEKFEAKPLAQAAGLELDGMTPYCVSPDAKEYVIASKKNKQLQVCKFGSQSPEKTVEINVAQVDSLFFDKPGQHLYVVYRDYKVEVYTADTLTLEHTYDTFSTGVEAVEYDEKSGNTILYGLTDGYVLDSQGDYIARIPAFRLLLPEKNEIVSCDYNDLYKIPFYGYDELLKEADRQLGN